MRNSVKSVVAAAAFVAAGAANAAVLETSEGPGGSGEIVVSILNDTTGLSMLVDTNVLATDLISGNVDSWASDATLTATINDFLDGSAGKFWVASAVVPSFFESTMLSSGTTVSSANILNAVNDYNGAAAATLIGPFADDLAGDGADVEGGLDSASSIGFNSNLGIWGSGGVELDGNAYITVSTNNFSGFTQTTLENYWTLSSDGQLSYVPVPAAVWLFGSALIGLAGVARRRRSA